MFKDFFDKPILIVGINDIRKGDFVHSLSIPNCLVESEKRQGYVLEIVSPLIPSGSIELQLTNRFTSLKVPSSATAVITRKEDS